MEEFFSNRNVKFPKFKGTDINRKKDNGDCEYIEMGLKIENVYSSKYNDAMWLYVWPYNNKDSSHSQVIKLQDSRHSDKYSSKFDDIPALQACLLAIFPDDASVETETARQIAVVEIDPQYNAWLDNLRTSIQPEIKRMLAEKLTSDAAKWVHLKQNEEGIRLIIEQCVSNAASVTVHEWLSKSQPMQSRFSTHETLKRIDFTLSNCM